MDFGLITTYATKPRKKLNKKYFEAQEKKASRLFGLNVSQDYANKNMHKIKKLAEDR